MSPKPRSRYKAPQSRPSYGPSATYGLKFGALLDLIETEGSRLNRRAESVLRQLAATLDENILQAEGLLRPRNDPSQEQAAAVRLALAEARLEKHQEAVNAAYGSRSVFFRWIGPGVAAPLQAAVVEAKQEVEQARKEWNALTERIKRQGTYAAPYPLDSAVNAQQFLDRARPARLTLHNAILGDLCRVEEDRVARDRAMAASLMERVRDEADHVKKRLPRTYPCPYCGGALGTDPCADHIVPVSHGGQSHQNNMVYVCSSCNLRKSNKTLREFAQQQGFNRDDIEKRLIQLGKRV